MTQEKDNFVVFEFDELIYRLVLDIHYNHYQLLYWFDHCIRDTANFSWNSWYHRTIDCGFLPRWDVRYEFSTYLLTGNLQIPSFHGSFSLLNWFPFPDHGGWERWFFNSSDPKTNKLFKKLELVPNVESGIRNTTKAFFWPYAFLGSQAELEYIVQANFTVTK